MIIYNSAGGAGGDGAGSGLAWQGAWEVATAYVINDVVTDGGVTYVCVADNTGSQPPSADWEVLAEGGTGLANIVEDTTPQLGGDLDCNGFTIYFGTAENVETPAGTTQDVNLGAGNHQTLNVGSASGDVTVTMIVPPGPCAGTLLVKQGATARDITWSPSSGTVKWFGTEPTWNADTNLWRLVSWRWDGTFLFLQATESAA